MGILGFTDEGTHYLLLTISLVSLIVSAIAICVSLQGFTVDLTTSRPLTYPLRDSLARPQDLVLNASSDLPNPYKNWSNVLQRDYV